MKTMIIGAVVLTACGRTDKLAFFDRAAWQASIRCAAQPPLNDGAVVTDLVSVGDTAFAALFADDRLVVTYGRHFATLHTLRFDPDGPRGVRNAVSAALADTTVLVADDARGLIKKFDAQGRDRGSIKLPFLPRRVRFAGGNLLVTPLVAGGTPAHLLFMEQNGSFRPLGAPIAQYDDLNTNTLANMVALATFQGGAVLMHELVVPFGYVVDFAHGRSWTRRFAVPLSSTVRDRVRRLPKPPITEKNVNELTVVAFAAASDAAARKTYYVTRIGDGRRSAYRKLLVQLDSAMHVAAVYPIDANPHHMVFVKNPPAIVGVDAASNWFECRLP